MSRTDKNDKLKASDLTELLKKLTFYKDLQSDFFKKINGNFEYYEDISKSNYFNSESTNILAILRYTNSIYNKINEIKDEDIENLYNLSLESSMNNVSIYEFIIFIAKYNKKINNFSLKVLLEKTKNTRFIEVLVDTFLRSFEEFSIFNFFKENDKIILKLIVKQMFKDRFTECRVLYNDRLMRYLLETNNLEFIDNFIEEYETIYIKNEGENEKFKISLKNKELFIKSKINESTNFVIKFVGLKNIYDQIDDIKDIIEPTDKDDLKKIVSSLLNYYSYSSVFDDDYLMNDKKIEILFNISKSHNIGNYLIDKLFENEVYFLKKLSLYFLVKNNMFEYLIRKVNEKSFDLEYMIRNSEFSGEIKEVFRLLNSYNNLEEIKEGNLLGMINKGKYFVYIDEEKDEEYIKEWRYKRFKELSNFKTIKKELESLKIKMKHDYELTPIIGKCEGGWVKKIASINSDESKSMNLNDWVRYMNEYKEKKHKDFLIEYDLEEDVKLFIECLKRNVDLFMSNINLLNNIKNYEWMYYIFNNLNKIIEKNSNDFSLYYENILILIDNYLENLDNIYEEPNKHSISKKHLVGKICSVLTTILNKIDINKKEIKLIYKRIIDKLEIKISNVDDFRKILAGKNDNFTSFINSIHRGILELEIVFSFKLKDFSEEKEYIEELILNRKEKSPKEFYIFLGEKLYSFIAIDKDFTENIITNMEKDIDKEMFLSGFAYCRVIDEERYNLLKSTILHVFDNEINDESMRSNIIEYYILAFLLGYSESDLDIINNKYNLDRNTIVRIFNLKNSCKKLDSSYNEKIYEEKIIEIWDKLLSHRWEETEFHLIEDTIIVLINFDSINEIIVKNLKKVIKNIPANSSLSYSVCRYLERIISLDNIKDIIEVIKCYKSDGWDNYIIELCEKIKKISEECFNEFKEEWIIINKEESPFRDYLLEIK
ncbi:hypothetical protein [Clostridium sp. LIBA-8841]|uniref:hypothetical protein n=1 Tax=Clostridium sp. LIBA-8841 TaxID=2987530 RepID=UPI002AC6D424|nr:hypothetical protein [Clostridium sp. LIBA-8841]MDZ5253803.1 hypothetical protein [Clostridium sp. LIBA-8841]